MNNCLVTKLKASVNNESLSKLNVLTIKIKASDSPTPTTQWINIKTTENGIASVNSENVGLYKTGIAGELLSYPVNVPINGILDSHFENKEGTIEIYGKYNLSALNIGNNGFIRIKEIYGIPGTITRLSVLNIEENEVDTTKLSNAINHSSLTYFNIQTSSVEFINKLNTNVVKEFVSIESLNPAFFSLFDNLSLNDIANNVNIRNLSAILAKGNISSLAKLTKLEEIYFDNSQLHTGDIMDFINPWIQAGRTSGKIKVHWMLGQVNITLNGQPISYPEGVTNQNAYLNWTSDGTVTFTAS